MCAANLSSIAWRSDVALSGSLSSRSFWHDVEQGIFVASTRRRASDCRPAERRQKEGSPLGPPANWTISLGPVRAPARLGADGNQRLGILRGRFQADQGLRKADRGRTRLLRKLLTKPAIPFPGSRHRAMASSGWFSSPGTQGRFIPTFASLAELPLKHSKVASLNLAGPSRAGARR